MKIGDKIIILKKGLGPGHYDIGDIAIIDNEICPYYFTCHILKNGYTLCIRIEGEGLSFRKYKKKIG